MLQFRKLVQKTRFLDPRADFAPVEIPSEIRFDPLTGESGRVAHFLPRHLPEPVLTEWEQSAQDSFCPFCPGQVDKVTPQFPAEICPQGRFCRGEALTFPNLSPYDQHSAVTVITAAHFPSLGEFTTAQLLDAFRVSLTFLTRVLEDEPQLHPLLSWNYLPPSGSSQIHPHLQVFASPVPGNRLQVELEAEASYRQAHGHGFWDDLLKEEKERGERYLGRVRQTEWLMAFRPYGVLGDILALLPEGELLPRLDKGLLADLIEGLQRLFLFFQHANIISFNLALYQSRTRLRLRVVPRLYLQQIIHTSDINSLQMLLGEPIAMVAPEDMAARIRPYFGAIERRLRGK